MSDIIPVADRSIRARLGTDLPHTAAPVTELLEPSSATLYAFAVPATVSVLVVRLPSKSTV